MYDNKIVVLLILIIMIHDSIRILHIRLRDVIYSVHFFFGKRFKTVILGTDVSISFLRYGMNMTSEKGGVSCMITTFCLQ